jgi:hypothetical protein
LLDIEVGRGLVEHVHIGLLNADGTDGETLKLTTGKEVDVTVHNVAELEGINGRLEVAQRVAALQKLANSLDALDSPGNLIDVLRLDNSLQVIFQKFGEVVCLERVSRRIPKERVYFEMNSL